MISPKFFIDTLTTRGITFFTGVPDSLLKYLCAYITDISTKENNIIAANEGAAVGLAAGYHLATGKTGVVYMQNSGLGNAVNPLMSLTDNAVYNIPVLLVIGWRGKPNIQDEPQHIKQGKVTLPLLDAMGIQFSVLSKDDKGALQQINNAVDYANATKEAYALVIEKGTFEEYKLESVISTNLEISRERAIQIVLDSLNDQKVVISTTGMISRELYEYREIKGKGHKRDFLTVGSMGHASQIALGIALHKPEKEVFCFDGDGSTIMHMGSMAITASKAPKNYHHIIFNNGAHDSVGGQPTAGLNINFKQIAIDCGYLTSFSVETETSLKKILPEFIKTTGPALLEIKVKKGSRKDLGRPTTTPIQNKEAFMAFLNKK